MKPYLDKDVATRIVLALAVIRQHGFEPELFDEETQTWELVDNTVSDATRSWGPAANRPIPQNVAEAVWVLNECPADQVERAINADREPPDDPDAWSGGFAPNH